MNETQPSPGTPKEILRSIQVLFGAIIAGATIFAIITLVLDKIQKTVSPVKDYENIFLIAAIGIAVICFTIALSAYRKMVAAAKDSIISLTDKLNQYRSALVRYIALCDAPALFGIILFFVTGNYLMLIVTAAMIVAMLIKAPTRKRVIEELSLDWQQQQELE